MAFITDFRRRSLWRVRNLIIININYIFNINSFLIKIRVRLLVNIETQEAVAAKVIHLDKYPNAQNIIKKEVIILFFHYYLIQLILFLIFIIKFLKIV